MRAPLCPGRGCRAKATGSSASAHSSVNDEGWSRQHSLAASPSNWQNSAASDERSSVASRLGCWAVKCLWFLKNARWLLITGNYGHWLLSLILLMRSMLLLVGSWLLQLEAICLQWWGANWVQPDEHVSSRPSGWEAVKGWANPLSSSELQTVDGLLSSRPVAAITLGFWGAAAVMLRCWVTEMRSAKSNASSLREGWRSGSSCMWMRVKCSDNSPFSAWVRKIWNHSV